MSNPIPKRKCHQQRSPRDTHRPHTHPADVTRGLTAGLAAGLTQNVITTVSHLLANTPDSAFFHDPSHSTLSPLPQLHA